jgi:hypothetical protein
MSRTHPNKLLEWTNLSFGSFLFCLPFFLDFPDLTAAAWNAYIFGALIVSCSAFALAKYHAGAVKTNLAAGAWVASAPFLLGFASSASAMWGHVLTGLSVATIAGLELLLAASRRPVK